MQSIKIVHENSTLHIRLFKSTRLLVFAICTSLLFSGCFDFIEDITLKDNGSGSIKATMNLSKSSTKVASLMKLKQIGGLSIPSKEQIQAQSAELAALLEKTKGISNVKYELDFKNFIASFSCDFSSIDALNTFSSHVAEHFNTNLNHTNSYAFQSKTGVFKRDFNTPEKLKTQFEKLSPTDKSYFETAYYTQIIRFNKEIHSSQNTTAKIAANKKAILLKLKATDIASGKASIKNTIQLKNN